MTARFKELMAEYGAILIGTHLTIFALVLAASAAAISAGWQPEGAAEGAGTLLAAYGFTQLMKFPRIAATVALTPVVASLVRRVPPGAAEASAEEDAEPEAEAA